MDIEQIAHVLSQINMHMGTTPYPYSYAQRCVLASYLCAKKHASAALHSRDFLADYAQVPTPSAEADKAHERARKFEQQILFGNGEDPITGVPLGQFSYLREVVAALRKLSSTRARDLYLERHYELVGGAA
jgi:hypothetical protein